MGQACETTHEPDAIRQQFPFHSEIESIFTARMQRMLWSEATEPSTSSKRKHHQFSSDEEEEEVDEPNQDINEELLSLVETEKKETEVVTTSTCTNPRKRAKKGKGIAGSTKAETAGSTLMKDILEEFMRQTVKMEKEWRDAWEMKEREREKREKEWRRRMAELEEERAAAERRWMEREEERRFREEARAQKRDSLIDALLNKLNRDHNDDHNQGF